MSLRTLFDDHATFYREQYLPFLQEEGFIDDPEDSEFAEGVDGYAPVDASQLDGAAAWPPSLRELLSEVGSCVVNYPTGRGPVPLYLLGPDEIARCREPSHKSVVSYLKKAAPPAPAASDAWPFLTDEGGGIFAFVSASDGRVHLVTHEGKLRGPIASIEAFFAQVFENARERRMPFDGMPGADAPSPDED